jgi:hypothetical protein
MASPLHHPEVAALLAATPWADIAVETRTGPHVTPAAFAAAGGRLWVVSSRRSLRVGAVRRTGRASALVRSGDRSLVVSGAAEVLSVWRRREMAALLAGGLPAARAATAYTRRNATLVLAGFVTDLLMGSGDPTVYDRVLISIEAERGMLVEGTEVRETWGRWRRPGRTAAASTATPSNGASPALPLEALIADVPAEVVESTSRAHVATVGLSTPAGPLALPALDTPGDSGRVHLPTAALAVAGLNGHAAACITVHESPGRRPSRFRGMVLRGDAHLLRRGAARTALQLEADRVSWWSGFASGTSRASA